MDLNVTYRRFLFLRHNHHFRKTWTKKKSKLLIMDNQSDAPIIEDKYF